MFMDSLQQNRTIVDTIDISIIALLSQRFSVTDSIGKIKKEQGLPSEHDAKREAEIITHLQHAYPQLDAQFIEELYRVIFAYSFNRQQAL